MKYAIAALCAEPMLAGCADLSKIIPGASAKFNTDLQAEKTLEAQLAADFRTEDKTLRFLSAEGYRSEQGYSCGDPKDPRIRRLPSVAKKAVKKDNANLSKALQNALATLRQYNASLTLIQQRDDQAKAALTTLKNLVDASAKIPGFPNVSAPVDAGVPIANEIVDLFSVEALVLLAREMDGHLKDAARVINENMTELTGGELNAFQLWDECARETLVYLREVPIGGVVGYQPHVGQSSGIELQAAYQGYLAKRASYQSPDLKDDLQAILDQNKNLMNGVTTSPDNLIAALGTATTFAGTLQPAAKTASSDPAAKTPTKKTGS